MTLYEHVEDFHALQALIDEAMTDDEGNIKELDEATRATLAGMADQWKDDFKAKAERVLKFRANVLSDADLCLAEAKTFQDEANRLKIRAEAHLNKVKGLNYLLMIAMQRIPVQKVETATFLVWLQKNPPSLVVQDESKIPEKYWEPVPATRALNKAELKKDLLAGDAVEWIKAEGAEEMTVLPGAVIIQETGLRVE